MYDRRSFLGCVVPLGGITGLLGGSKALLPSNRQTDDSIVSATLIRDYISSLTVPAWMEVWADKCNDYPLVVGDDKLSGSPGIHTTVSGFDDYARECWSEETVCHGGLTGDVIAPMPGNPPTEANVYSLLYLCMLRHGMLVYVDSGSQG